MQLPVLSWRCAIFFAERAVEVSGIFKPALYGNRVSSHVVRAQKVGSVLNSDLVDVLRQCHAKALIGRAADMFAVATTDRDESSSAAAEHFRGLGRTARRGKPLRTH